MAKDKVVAGDYMGADVFLSLSKNGPAYIKAKDGTIINIDKKKVASIEVLDESSRKNVASAVGRAAVGTAILGPVGLVAGLTAKNNKDITLSISFKDGKRSMVEIRDAIYKRILASMY